MELFIYFIVWVGVTATFSFRFCDEGTCTDKANILYAWARDAPPTRLPKGTSEMSCMSY